MKAPSPVTRFLLSGLVGMASTAIAAWPVYQSFVSGRSSQPIFSAFVMSAILGMTSLPIGLIVSEICPSPESRFDGVLLEVTGGFVLATLAALVFVDPLLMLFGSLLIPAFVGFGHMGNALESWYTLGTPAREPD